MRFEQIAELQERGGIGHRLQAQIDAGEAAHRLPVVNRVLQRPVGQTIPLLEEVDAQHPLDANRRSSFRGIAHRFGDFSPGIESAILRRVLQNGDNFVTRIVPLKVQATQSDMNQTQKITAISQKTLLFLVLSGLATGASWLCYFKALQMGDRA